MGKQATFDQYLSNLNLSIHNLNKPGLILLWGPSDYLIIKGIEALLANFKKCSDGEHSSFEANQLKPISFEPLWQQQDLFSLCNLHIIKRLETKPSFTNLLADIPDSQLISNHLVLTSNSKSIPAKVEKECTRLKATIIPCFEPRAHELPKFISKLSLKKNLPLDQSSIRLLIESQGTDLFKLDNELEKLSNIFPDHTSPLSPQEIRSFIGIHNTDHLFTLESHIISNRRSCAQVLITSLLRKGEPPIALVGFIANLIRKALKVSYLIELGYDDHRIANTLYVPVKAIENYRKFTSSRSLHNLVKALDQCRATDHTLKSNRTSAEVLISRLIMSLEV